MLDPRQVDTGTAGPIAGQGQPLYARPMPGGGYVRVELVMSDRGDVTGERRCGRVVIEPREPSPRRAESPSPRRAESPSLVVEEVEGDDENAIVAECFRIARDNAAIARRVLRRRMEARRAD